MYEVVMNCHNSFPPYMYQFNTCSRTEHPQAPINRDDASQDVIISKTYNIVKHSRSQCPATCFSNAV